MVCNKCGEEMRNKDEKYSNENWSVFTKLDCDCGGRFSPKFVVENNKKEA